ncbi:unnamed protein product [Protopolystoma xenopodis]|uniref:Uncharacterized protein n=1 Tax=Protopolystoma xenopodis TaxID=117903 RepID=A0A3S5ADX4_9PLAT|nr:unnamed protein product [Protopolystoma xenopodis]
MMAHRAALGRAVRSGTAHCFIPTPDGQKNFHDPSLPPPRQPIGQVDKPRPLLDPYAYKHRSANRHALVTAPLFGVRLTIGPERKVAVASIRNGSVLPLKRLSSKCLDQPVLSS